MEKKLSDFYYSNPLFPTVKELVKKFGITYREAQDFINAQEVNQLHKPPPKKIKYYPIMGQRGTVQSDLTFFDQYKHQNRGYKLIMTVIEVNSRKGYAIPLKNKTIDSIIEAFDHVIDLAEKNGEPIVSVTTDSGSEYKTKFTDFLHKKGIKHYLTDPGDKHGLGMAERFNRTIRSSIEKYMTAYNTSNWVDVLPDIIDGYNNREHSSTGFAPDKVGDREFKLIQQQKWDQAKDVPRYNLMLGDTVRLRKPFDTFEKRSGERFYRGVYTISKVSPMSYRLTNEAGDELLDRYQQYQLVKINQIYSAKDKDKNHDRDLVKKERKIERDIKKEGLDTSNILKTKRR